MLQFPRPVKLLGLKPTGILIERHNIFGNVRSTTNHCVGLSDNAYKSVDAERKMEMGSWDCGSQISLLKPEPQLQGNATNRWI